MPPPTSPAIKDRQNTDRSLRLLAAQRRLYADAKLIHNTRVVVILIAGIVGAVLAITFPHLRPQIGFTTGLLLFAISAMGTARERRRSREASSVQEEFDLGVFDLPRSPVLSDRPSNPLIAEAAKRCKSKKLQDWYTDPNGLPRPLDVLVCQRSNLAWGISAHLRWAALMAALAAALIASAVATSFALHLTFADSMLGIFAPLTPTLKELYDMWRNNLDSARAKEKAEAKAAALWDHAMNTGTLPSVQDCRELQDRILLSRQTNAVIPDWFYWLFRNTNENAMVVGVADYVEEARSQGRI